MRDAKHLGLAALAAAGFVAVAAGCGGDSGTGPLQLQMAVFATPASIPADGTSTIIAQVTTDRAQPASNVPIEWGTSFAVLMVSGSTGGRTDASGRATATLRGDGRPGVAVVTARVFGRPGVQAQVEVRIGLD